jgi:hypothetical protein
MKMKVFQKRMIWLLAVSFFSSFSQLGFAQMWTTAPLDGEGRPRSMSSEPAVNIIELPTDYETAKSFRSENEIKREESVFQALHQRASKDASSFSFFRFSADEARSLERGKSETIGQMSFGEGDEQFLVPVIQRKGSDRVFVCANGIEDGYCNGRIRIMSEVAGNRVNPSKESLSGMIQAPSPVRDPLAPLAFSEAVSTAESLNRGDLQPVRNENAQNRGQIRFERLEHVREATEKLISDMPSVDEIMDGVSSSPTF